MCKKVPYITAIDLATCVLLRVNIIKHLDVHGTVLCKGGVWVEQRQDRAVNRTVVRNKATTVYNELSCIHILDRTSTYRQMSFGTTTVPGTYRYSTVELRGFWVLMARVRGAQSYFPQILSVLGDHLSQGGPKCF